MAEYPDSSPISSELREYDEDAAKKLAEWVFGLAQHAHEGRKAATRESQWENDMQFLIGGKQWDGASPSWRRPITVNMWRRSMHILLAILTGGRPILKVVPQGLQDMKALEVWQHALWSVVKTEKVIDKWTKALIWALVMDGGWLKIGYGSRDPLMSRPDVMVTAPHPSNILPDPECEDASLAECGYVIYADALDLATITRRYPEHGWRVKLDSDSKNTSRSFLESSTIRSSSNWDTPSGHDKNKIDVYECWIDDPAVEYKTERQVVDMDLTSMQPIYKEVGRWVPKYPYGRVITSTHGVILRDIPNPYGTAFGWEMRYPFVYVPGAEAPNQLWRPGLCSDLSELGRSANKSMSLILENFMKVTNAIVIADEQAMEDYEWNTLTLFPGAKIRKARGTEVKVEFPPPLPAQAMAFPDFLIRKMEEVVGLHDPPINPGQAVAAKTVNFLQQKGHFLVGEMAKLAEGSLEQLGTRIAALQRNRYLPGRKIPMFVDDQVTAAQHHWPELPDSLEVRVEASSGWAEVMAAALAKSNDDKGKKK